MGFADPCLTSRPTRHNSDFLMLTVCLIDIKAILSAKIFSITILPMRTCSACNKTKTEENFFYRSKRNNKLHAQCKECYIIKRRKIWKDHYHKYGSKYRERAVERNKKLKTRLKLLLIEYLSDKSCIMCGNSDPRVLEFDHLDPNVKSFEIARAIHNTISWDKILVEIEKCQILCANCHKIRTSEQQRWFKASI